MSAPEAREGWEVLARAAELAARGEEFALATVVWRQAPSSGQQGSRAIVTADGRIHGWIGGACAEPTVIREAREVIAGRRSKLLLLGTLEQFGGAVPDGVTVTPIACQSEGALQVFIEPVLPAPRLVVVGRSPMARTLVDLALALGWRAELVAADDVGSAGIDERSVVIVATQGHGDEEALERVLAGGAGPAYVGLVASRVRGEAVLGYLADRGVPRERLDRVRVPVGIDLGHTTHREIAVSVLAELVQRRAAGELVPSAHAGAGAAGAGAAAAGAAEAAAGGAGALLPLVVPAEAVDPVCGMTVAAAPSSRPFEYQGTTYYFCCPGCRSRFAKNPAAYLPAAEADPAPAGPAAAVAAPSAMASAPAREA